MRRIRRYKKDSIFTHLQIDFYTECGDELEYFSLSEDVNDFKSMVELFNRCLRTGKFKGEICSKFFICDSGSFGSLLDEVY